MTTDLTIATQVADHHRETAGQLPAEVIAAFAAEQRELAAAGLPAGTARPGDRMPDGKLLDVPGQPTTLAETPGAKAAVMS